MKSIRISIVTVVLNDLIGLKNTMESILIQTFNDYEWIVCDGGSGEGITDYLKGIGDRVVWVSKPDLGIYDAMNRGVAMSSGDYIVFMNAGDSFSDSDTLTKVVKKLSEREVVPDILFGGAMLSFPESGKMVYRAPRKVEHSLWHGVPANHQATYYRRALLVVTPYDLRYRLCGDYYLASKLISTGAVACYLDETLAKFEVGGQSYKHRRRMFVEPWLIQRDVLSSSIFFRLLSVVKRFISFTGFIVLSQSVLKRK